MTPQQAAAVAAARPRVEGVREQEILQATLDVLAEVGYDRLTMDAVAHAAKASKATLYRRWSSKAALVIDAVLAQKGPTSIPDTGSLREDLLQMHCGTGGVTDPRAVGVLASVITAVNIDPEFATAFRRDFVGPKVAIGRSVFERAKARGEIHTDVDLDLWHLLSPGWSCTGPSCSASPRRRRPSRPSSTRSSSRPAACGRAEPPHSTRTTQKESSS